MNPKQVLPVFLNYPERGSAEVPADAPSGPIFFTGGFGLDSGSIGTIFMGYGVVCGVVQFLLFPPLCARFGVLRCFRGCALAFPFVYVLTPYTGQMGPGWVRYAALVAVMSVKAFGIALKLTFAGSNQFSHPSTYVFMILTAVCILTQMNYFNKALSQFSTQM